MNKKFPHFYLEDEDILVEKLNLDERYKRAKDVVKKEKGILFDTFGFDIECIQDYLLVIQWFKVGGKNGAITYLKFCLENE